MKQLVGIIVIIISLSGCSVTNVVKGSDDYNRNYMAQDIYDSIDKAIVSELSKNPPNGYLSKPYSREIWNKYWNIRIDKLYSLGITKTPKAYDGQSGKEFIRYIFVERRNKGLPDIQIEERNRSKIPGA